MNEARAVPCDTYSQRSAAIWQTRTADVVLRPVDGCVSGAVEGLALELMGLLRTPSSKCNASFAPYLPLSSFHALPLCTILAVHWLAV